MLVSVVFLLSAFVVVHCIRPGEISPAELSALSDLFAAANGARWTWLNNSQAWNFSRPIPCAQQRVWEGLTCACPSTAGAAYCNVTAVSLVNHNLQGTLPSSIGALSSLATLLLNTNNLHGTIPASVGALRKLSNLQINFNHLQGTVPLLPTSMVTLDLNTNELVGTMPSSLSQSSKLVFVNFAFNSLTGTVPQVWPSTLARLYFLFNHIHGIIPASLCNTSLIQLNTLSNSMTGTLPACFGRLANIVGLTFDTNHFTGTIPDAWQTSAVLRSIGFAENQLTGTIPSWLCSLPQLNGFDLGANHMHGTVPPCMYDMSPMLNFYLNGNQFTGTISDVSKFVNALQITYSNNFFHGTLPESFYHLPKLARIGVTNNMFTGTISNSVNHLSSLRVFNAFGNELTGTLPSGFSTLKLLSQLDVSFNRLTGNLSQVFNATAQIGLQNFVIGGNFFTGIIPSEVFRLPALLVFSAFSNCMEVKLPDNVCNAVLLNTLVLDGIRTADTCRDKIFPHSSYLKAYMLPNENHATIPPCLYSMPHLVTLHLSGIGLEGSLPDNVMLSKSFVDLSLSHNSLTGSIPTLFQNRSWTNLDLSFNFLTGGLSKDLLASEHTPIKSMSLQVNRLSGDIPGAVKQVVNISMLDGNLFSCDYAGDQLPQRDSHIDSYDCGSNTFNASYYLWIATLVFVAGFGVICLLFVGMYGLSQSEGMYAFVALQGMAASMSSETHMQLQRVRYLWTIVPLPDPGLPFAMALNKSLMCVSVVFDSVWTLCVRLIAYLLIVLVPVYAACSAYYGTYSNKYAWSLSIAYLAGNAALAAELAVLLVLLSMVVITLHHNYNGDLKVKEVEKKPSYELTEVDEQSVDTKEDIELPSIGQQITPPAPIPTPVIPVTPRSVLNIVLVVIFTLNLVLAGGVNVLFAFVSINGTNEQLFWMQIALTLFGYIWNGDRIQWLSTELLSWFMGSKSLLSLKHGKYFDSAYMLQLRAKEIAEQKDMLQMQLYIAVINAVLIPSVVTAALSSSCFYYALRAAPQVDAIYDHFVCSVVMFLPNGSAQCMAYRTYTYHTSYDPPYSYSYQCSSVLLTYYAPSLMYTCVTDGFISPALQVFTCKLYSWLAAMTTDAGDGIGLSWCRDLLGNIAMWMKWRIVPDLLQPIETEEDSRVADYAGQTFVSSQSMVVNLVTYMSLLLTFGVVFPPLGVALAVTILIYLCFNRWVLGRYMLEFKKLLAARSESSVKSNASSSIADALVLECSGFPNILQLAKWMLIVSACWFYALFMADTIGYEHGTALTYWVIVFMALAPLAYWGTDQLISFVQSRAAAH